jgi:thioredoxin 1
MKVVKMPVDDNPSTVKTYKVEGVPAIRLFKGGDLLHSWEGAITKAKLIAMIDQHFPG